MVNAVLYLDISFSYPFCKLLFSLKESPCIGKSRELDRGECNIYGTCLVANGTIEQVQQGMSGSAYTLNPAIFPLQQVTYPWLGSRLLQT
jgi:hypothetical protein